MPIDEKLSEQITEKFGDGATAFIESLTANINNDVSAGVEATKSEHQATLDAASAKVQEYEQTTNDLKIKSELFDALKLKLKDEYGFDGADIKSIKAKPSDPKKPEESDEYKSVTTENSILKQELAKISETQTQFITEFEQLKKDKIEADKNAAVMDIKSKMTLDLKNNSIAELIIDKKLGTGEVYKKNGEIFFKVKGRLDVPDTYDEGMKKIKEKYKSYVNIPQNSGAGSHGGSQGDESESGDILEEAAKWMKKKRG